MARRKSPAEVGPLGVWAYDTRDALDLSVEAAVAALPTHYHPATLRKVEGGSARPGTRMWRELGNLYARIASEKGIAIDAQPRLAPEPLERPETPDGIIRAIEAQTAAMLALVEAIQMERAETAVARQELMRALAALAGRQGPRGTPTGDELDTPAAARR